MIDNNPPDVWLSSLLRSEPDRSPEDALFDIADRLSSVKSQELDAGAKHIDDELSRLRAATPESDEISYGMPASFEEMKVDPLARIQFLQRLADLVRMETASRPRPAAVHRLTAEDVLLEKASPDVVKRLTIIAQNPNFSALDLCRQFDFHSVPIPERWKGKRSVTNWVEAYNDAECRKLVQPLISKERRRLQSCKLTSSH